MASITNPSAPIDRRPIDRRIAALADVLTGSERRLADVVLGLQQSLGSFTAAELAARANVSNATAVRFFQRLGYPSFGDVRRQARDVRWASPLDEWTGLDTPPDHSDFAAYLDHDRRSLALTAAQIPPSALREALDLLLAARTVWVVGFRNSAALAALARALLIQVKQDVRLLPHAGMTLAEDLVGLGPDQAMLVIGFRRRPPVLRDIMAAAQAAAVPTILVADDSAAATARRATVVLRCEQRGYGMFDSYAAPVSVLNYLATRVALEGGATAAARLREIENLHEKLTSFDRPRPDLAPHHPAGHGPADPKP